MNLDDAFHEAGTFGKAQKWMVIICLLVHCFSGWPMAFPFLNSDKVSFDCAKHETNTTNEAVSIDNAHSPHKRETHSGKNKGKKHHHVKHDEVEPAETDSTCDDWCVTRKYHQEESASIYSYFDLGCSPDADIYLLMATYAFTTGLVTGCFIMGLAGDTIGRKTFLCFGLLFELICSFLVPFSPNVQIYTIIQVLQGLFMSPALLHSIILVVESCSQKHSARIIVTYLTSAIVGYVTASICKTLLPSWRLQAMVMIVPRTFNILVCVFKLYESGRWLYYTGNTKAAEFILRSIANLNGKTAGRISLTGRFQNLGIVYTEKSADEVVSDEDEENLELDDSKMLTNANFRKNNPEQTLGKFYELFGTWRTSALITYSALALATTAYIEYHFLAAMQDLLTVPWIIIDSISLVKLSSWFYCLFVDAIGRKYVALVLLFCAVLINEMLFLLKPFLPQLFSVILACFGFHLAAASENILVVSAVEQFPTQLRASGVGVVMAISHTPILSIAILCSIGYYTSTTISMLTSGVVAISSVLLGHFFAVETARKSLPETVGQYYLLTRAKTSD